MNLKFLLLFLVYYGLLSAFFISAGLADDNPFDSANYTDPINSSDIADDIPTGTGIFSSLSLVGIVGRLLAFLAIGLGLPGSPPVWVALLFGLWQSCVTIAFAMFIVSSVWDG